ncbi:hypothetical protein QCA50_015444 [Cerrena zonata]|uniref:T6SS Phospholipase effector Tle1-like catalytic domain-containing protein n=1 Tax=Cerrena zonata TaxID=2478898 RepID=A0AAW0FI34_9APHY
MLHKIGLLPKDNFEQVPFAYKLYKKPDAKEDEGEADSQGFKRIFCREVDIEFVGVWDTVASVGLFTGRTLPFISTNDGIKTFRHALSLDEHRAKFRPNCYHRHLPAAGNTAPGWYIKRLLRKLFPCKRKKTVTKATKPETDCVEVWFAGCHSDVGGGAVANSTVHCLADISLEWMVRQVDDSTCRIRFDRMKMKAMFGTTFPDFKSDPDITGEQTSTSITNSSQYPSPNPTLATESSGNGDTETIEPGGRDGSRNVGSTSSGMAQPTPHIRMTPLTWSIHDELKRNRLWWLLEIIPTTYSYQDSKGVWQKQRGLSRFHLGKGRVIPGTNPTIHKSVQTRKDNPTFGYMPRAQWKGTESYVD